MRRYRVKKSRISRLQLPSQPTSRVTRGCLLLFTLVIVIGFGGLVVIPLSFHLLPDQYQRGIARRLPLINSWLPTDIPAPTRAYTADALPTADGANSLAAMALLDKPAVTNDPNNQPTATVVVGTPVPSATPQSPINSASSSGGSGIATLAPSFIVSADTPVPMVNVTTSPPTAAPLPLQFNLTGFTLVPQGWNDCGPANLTQVLNAYGLTTTQEKVAAWLKPNYDSKNVSPWQLAAYVNQFTQYKALSRVNGSLTLLKKLLVAQFRFIIETGFTVPNNPGEGWMGHYLTPVGYDGGQALFYGFDSYLGDGTNHQGRPENADDLDTRWQQFNRVYIIVYPPERADELAALLGADVDVMQNAQGAVKQATQDATNNPVNPFAWFNLGSSYVILQNYKDAVTAYDQARNVGGGLPWRMLWYQFGPFAAYYHVGDYKTTQQLITATLGTTTFIEEPYYWRGMVEAAQNKSQPAIGDFSTALRFNPNNHFTADALNAVRAGTSLPTPEMP